MDPDEWTPARGWMIALGKSAYRTAAGSIFVGVVLYFIWHIDRYLPAHWSMLILSLLVTAAVGYPVGYAVARKLVEDCGLAGGTILLPVLMILIVGEVAACLVVEALRGQWGMLAFVSTGGIIMWSLAACAKTILLE